MFQQSWQMHNMKRHMNAHVAAIFL